MKQKDNITIKTLPQKIEISFPIWNPSAKKWTRHLWIIIYLGIVGQLVALRIEGESVTIPMIVGFAVFGFIGFRWAFREPRYKKQSIVLSSDTLTIGEKTRYENDRIEHIRVNTETSTYERGTFERDNDIEQSEHGTILAKYGTETIELCKNIPIPEGKHLAKMLTDMLTFRCHVIRQIIFGNEPIDPSATLRNPDVSSLTAPFCRLNQLVIHTDTADMHQLERFLTYAVTYMDKRYLKQHVGIHIYGNNAKVSPNLQNMLHKIGKRVHVHDVEYPALKDKYAEIRTVLFGSGEFRGVNPITTLQNPDVSLLTQSMPKLRSIKIHIDTYDFHLLERFLTYTVNYVGQKYLKDFVEVELYGTPEHLHPNLRNTLTNLCRRVNVHDVHDM